MVHNDIEEDLQESVFVCAVLQARFSSSRLPGKVLLPILDRPMLEYQIERITAARSLNHLVLATSDQPDDDQIALLARRMGLECFRGALDDVLGRVHGAIRKLQPDHVVRLTGDCLLADPAVIDLVVEQHLASGADYTSNTLDRTFADGLDVEIATFKALSEAEQVHSRIDMTGPH